jgi:hypothetical protein
MNSKFENILVLVLPVLFIVVLSCVMFSACEHVINHTFTACDESICMLKDFTNGP